MRKESGFSLIETVIAMGLLAFGLLSLAGVFVLGMRHMSTSSPGLIAREKAREAVESVHTARDTRVITWAQIRNEGEGGVFLDGPQDLRAAGDDGLVNTDDDADEEIEFIVDPGPDRILGNQDDERTTLENFEREIVINDILDAQGNVNQTLRELIVIITYTVGQTTRTYRLTTYISSIS
jgi:type II secretory pathway pseudopilin PulG